MIFIPFEAGHLPALRAQGVHADAAHLMTLGHGRQIASQDGMAYTAIGNGEPIACAGCFEVWRGRAYAWAYFTETALKQFRPIHRAVLAQLRYAQARWHRIEMSVHVDHLAAQRWAFHLGFELECTARKWTPDGKDIQIWARVT